MSNAYNIDALDSTYYKPGSNTQMEVSDKTAPIVKLTVTEPFITRTFKRNPIISSAIGIIVGYIIYRTIRSIIDRLENIDKNTKDLQKIPPDLTEIKNNTNIIRANIDATVGAFSQFLGVKNQPATTTPSTPSQPQQLPTPVLQQQDDFEKYMQGRCLYVDQSRVPPAQQFGGLMNSENINPFRQPQLNANLADASAILAATTAMGAINSSQYTTEDGATFYKTQALR